MQMVEMVMACIIFARLLYIFSNSSFAPPFEIRKLFELYSLPRFLYPFQRPLRDGPQVHAQGDGAGVRRQVLVSHEVSKIESFLK